jgi:hypothetical protein
LCNFFFLENGLDADTLPIVTKADLTAVGVMLGPCLKLLGAIKQIFPLERGSASGQAVNTDASASGQAVGTDAFASIPSTHGVVPLSSIDTQTV